MFKPFTFLTFVLLLLLANAAHAQKGPKNTISASRSEEAIKIDGVFDEPSWHNATMVGNFVQNFPDAGAPSAFDTRVRVLYTSFGLYVAAEMNTPAGGISDQINERDNLNFTDYFELFLDGFHDGTQGYAFAVSVAGVQADSKYESIDYRSYDWNAVWNVSTRKTENGWVAEMEIPYGAIRFSGNKPAQIWNINFKRFHFKSNETSYWNPVNPALPGITNQTGELVGVMNPHTRGRLQVNSGLNSSMALSKNEDLSVTQNMNINTSLDLKIGLSDAFTLDVRPLPTIFRSASSAVSNVSSTFFFSENNQLISSSNYGEGNDIFRNNQIYSPLINNNLKLYDTLRLFFIPDVRVENYHTSKLSGRTPGKTGIGVYNSVYAPYTQTVFDPTFREIRNPNTLVNVVAIDQTLLNNSKVFIDNSIINNGRSSYVYTIGGTTLRDKYNKWALNVEGSSEQNDSKDSRSALYNYGIALSRTAGNFIGGIQYNAQQLENKLTQSSDLVRNRKSNYGFNVGYRNFKPWKNWNSIQAGFSYSQSNYESGNKNSSTRGSVSLLNRKFQRFSLLVFYQNPQKERVFYNPYSKTNYIINQSPKREIRFTYSSDFRKKISFNTSIGHYRSIDGTEIRTNGSLGLSWRPSNKAGFGLSYNVSSNKYLFPVFSLNMASSLPDSNLVLGNIRSNNNSIRLSGSYAFTNVFSIGCFFSAGAGKTHYTTFYDILSEGQLSPSAYTGRNADNVSFHDQRNISVQFNVDVNYRFYYGTDLFVNFGSIDGGSNYSLQERGLNTFVSSGVGGSLGIRCQLDYAFFKHHLRR